MREQLNAAETRAAAASAEAAAMRSERDAALAAPPPAASAQEPDLREFLSNVKIAVLAPCLRLHINGAESLHVGSAEQIDFGTLCGMLEAAVLKKYSQVSLLDANTPLAKGGEAGAYDIFPELKEIMAHVQREVKERLVTMMQTAGEGEAAPGAEEKRRTATSPNGRRTRAVE